MKALGVDLTRLDFVVMSHRHGDHMGGLAYLLEVNPGVKIYAPKEGFGVYGGSLPGSFYRRDASLTADMRYYAGSPPEVMRFGSAWPKANFELIDKTTEVAPGVTLIALVSEAPGTRELKEQFPDLGASMTAVRAANVARGRSEGAARSVFALRVVLARHFVIARCRFCRPRTDLSYGLNRAYRTRCRLAKPNRAYIWARFFAIPRKRTLAWPHSRFTTRKGCSPIARTLESQRLRSRCASVSGCTCCRAG